MRISRLVPFAAAFVAVVTLADTAAARTQAPRPAAECFPFESLPADLRERAETLLLKALDGEALYTIGADLKPISSGILGLSIDVTTPDLAEVEAIRRILATWACGGELQAGLQHFAAVRENKRYLDVAVFNLPRLAELMDARAPFFGRYGLSPSAFPIQILLAVEHDPTPDRFRGYGYLFGYPDYAVDFFVGAAESEKAGGPFVERDFISLPTVLGERHFVYAVPKGHQPNETDAALRASVDAVYQDYVARRATHISTDGGAAGVLALVREWFDDGTGDVRPSNAWKRRGKR